MFRYRDAYLRTIHQGPQRDPGNSGTVRCQHCGAEATVHIDEWVADAFPSPAGSPRYTLESQAILQGWMVAPAQIATGQGLSSWDLTLCPGCVDGLLRQVERTAGNKTPHAAAFSFGERA